MEIGSQIRRYRERDQFSQEELAAKFMFPDRRYRTGKTTAAIRIYKI